MVSNETFTFNAGSAGQTAPSLGGGILSIFGMLNSAIGTFYAIDAQKGVLRSQESAFGHQQAISQVNARAAEDQAVGIQQAGESAVAAHSMQAEAQKSANRASQAASGIALGSGSAAEVEASADIINQIDQFNIEANVARSVAAARTQRQNVLNQGAMAGVSAENAAASRGSINQFTGVSTSLLSDATTLAREWRFAQRPTQTHRRRR